MIKLSKKQVKHKFGYQLYISRAPGDPYRPVGELHESKYLAEQYFHRKLSTSITATRWRVQGVRLNVDKTTYMRKAPHEHKA